MSVSISACIQMRLTVDLVPAAGHSLRSLLSISALPIFPFYDRLDGLERQTNLMLFIVCALILIRFSTIVHCSTRCFPWIGNGTQTETEIGAEIGIGIGCLPGCLPVGDSMHFAFFSALLSHLPYLCSFFSEVSQCCSMRHTIYERHAVVARVGR